MPAMDSQHPLATPRVPEQLLTLDDIAQTLQVPKGTVYKWSAAGDPHFPRCLRIGKHIRVRRSDFAAWMEGQLR